MLVEGWERVEQTLQKRFGKEADLKSVLFIIGLREFGKKQNGFTKEEKQDLMNLATCCILSREGYFALSHMDEDGWPIFKQSKPLPVMDNRQQELFIKENVVEYFIAEKLFED